MNTTRHSRFRQRQEGAITIIVVLMLLVLLMVAAFGMSRDALRELKITSSSRQGQEVFNEADTGINWSVFWMYTPNQALGSASTGGKALATQMGFLTSNPDQLGKPVNIPSTADMIMTPSSNKSAKFNIDLTQMGRLPSTGISQNVDASLVSPLVWSVRSNASVTYAGSATFQHSRESWITTPVSHSAN
ncbi:MAG TPA: PilX N-terminal domain-containing pilus assembly protein [Holophagaceae bacterium]|jgi:Tfp pilus assembly protein PilX|nr:PilX N-terminal domain-containing pilus assembly protein [Holophagaceae bacterium]